MRVEKEVAAKIEALVLESFNVEDWGEQGALTLVDLVQDSEEEPCDIKIILESMGVRGLVKLTKYRNRPWLVSRA